MTCSYLAYLGWPPQTYHYHFLSFTHLPANFVVSFFAAEWTFIVYTCTTVSSAIVMIYSSRLSEISSISLKFPFNCPCLLPLQLLEVIVFSASWCSPRMSLPFQAAQLLQNLKWPCHCLPYCVIFTSSIRNTSPTKPLNMQPCLTRQQLSLDTEQLWVLSYFVVTVVYLWLFIPPVHLLSFLWPRAMVRHWFALLNCVQEANIECTCSLDEEWEANALREAGLAICVPRTHPKLSIITGYI